MTLARESQAELHAWYLRHLRPKVADAVAAGIIAPADAAELDRQLRDFLELPDEAPVAARVRLAAPAKT